jgi:acetolactate synthase-1/2/3 large subunit
VPVVRDAAPVAAQRPPDAAIEAAARILRGKEQTGLILGGRATRESSLSTLGKIARATGAKLLAQTYTPRISRGAGRVAVERIPYAVDQAVAALRPYGNLVLIGAKAPVAFFAYPNKPSMLWQPGVRIHELVRVDGDIEYTLAALADAVGASSSAPEVTRLDLPSAPTGDITPDKLGCLIAALLPSGAIVVDESLTTGRTFLAATQTAHPHEWILPTGGSIGYALPAALGAAIACPDRKVLALESDGSGLYNPQALWSLARESLNVLTIIFANRRYQILRTEMKNVGATQIGPNASALLDIDKPTIEWVELAKSFGVDAYRAQTMEELERCIGAALHMNGPCLIEAIL